MESLPDIGAFTQFSYFIAGLIYESPVKGIGIVLFTFAIFVAILASSTIAVIKILRAGRKQDFLLFNKEDYLKNIASLTRDMESYESENAEMCRRHERMISYSIVKNQMDLSDAYIKRKISEVALSFRNFICEECIDLEKILQRKAMDEYQEATTYIYHDLLDFFRKTIKANHFADKSDVEYSREVNVCLEVIKIKILNGIDTYFTNDIIPVKLIQSKASAKLEKFEFELRDLFLNLRNISIEYGAIIERERKDYNDRWNEFLAEYPERLLKGVVKYDSK